MSRSLTIIFFILSIAGAVNAQEPPIEEQEKWIKKKFEVADIKMNTFKFVDEDVLLLNGYKIADEVFQALYFALAGVLGLELFCRVILNSV